MISGFFISFRRMVCLAAAMFLLSWAAFAQGAITIKGTVKDETGQPLIGAAVMVDGSTVGVVTDIDGNYSITFTPNSKITPALVFSSISYESQTVPVAGKRVINVVLKEDSEQLDEVVVVGYGAMRKSDITGALTSVKI